MLNGNKLASLKQISVLTASISQLFNAPPAEVGSFFAARLRHRPFLSPLTCPYLLPIPTFHPNPPVPSAHSHLSSEPACTFCLIPLAWLDSPLYCPCEPEQRSSFSKVKSTLETATGGTGINLNSATYSQKRRGVLDLASAEGT